MTITRIMRYCTDDPECDGDYCEVILKHVNKVIATFGDAYHDKGWEKSEGFLAGLRFAKGDVRVDEKDVADYVC